MKGFKVFIIQWRILLLCMFLATVGGIVYGKLSTPIYEVTASAVMIRSTMPPVVSVTPEPRNRWVWIRDGMSLKEMIQRDDIFLEIIRESKELSDRYIKFSSKFKEMENNDLLINYVQKLKSSVEIQYTGGDSNIFIFKARDKNASVAKYIVEYLIKSLRTSYSDLMLNRRKDYLKELNHSAGNIIKDEIEKRSSHGFGVWNQYKMNALSEAYGRLYVENLLQNVQGRSNIKIIKIPHIPTSPIWPRMTLILLFSILGGSLIGLLLKRTSLHFSKSKDDTLH